MAVYLYAICSCAPPQPEGTGLRGEPLRLIGAQGLSALVSDCAPGAAESADEELWRHEGAVEALMAHGDVLPVRFGTTLASDEAVRAVLAERKEEFDAALTRVAGACELAVRGVLADGDTPAPSTGTGYLGLRAAAEQRAEMLWSRLQTALSPLARASRLRVLALPRMQVAGAYLVPRAGVARFVSELERLDGETPEAELVCTGPWPPYSFTTGGASPA